VGYQAKNMTDGMTYTKKRKAQSVKFKGQSLELKVLTI